MKNVDDILKKWLKDNGYEGLCRPDIECGCALSDFMPCPEEYDCRKCVPARDVPPPNGVDACHWMEPGRRRGWRKS